MHEPPDSQTCEGLMFIGDPHLEARIPGFRRDDYPEVALRKFRWCLTYARQHRLQPFLLGDLFQLPQDNPNWLLTAIIDAIDEPLPAIYGNHDVRENSLKDNDSIQILFTSGHLTHVSLQTPWTGQVAGRSVLVAGSDWGQRLPQEVPANEFHQVLTVWLTHHDILIPGYEESGRIRPREIEGIDLIVNGHVHRALAPVTKGRTHWYTAGNITRRSRSDASRSHVPAIPCLMPVLNDADTAAETDFDFTAAGQRWKMQRVTVPHEPFDEVFHPEVISDDTESGVGSGFVADLRELTARRTDSGAGLHEFLKQHLDQFDAPVAAEILKLAAQVTQE